MPAVPARSSRRISRRRSSRRAVGVSVVLVALGGVAAPAAVAAHAGAHAGTYAGTDALRVTVRGAGAAGADGTRTLVCRPAPATHPDAHPATHPGTRGGTHAGTLADPARACAALEEAAAGGRDPFAPVAEDSACTLQYGGPATAHVTGTWHGRPVDARFSRADGCQIARWDALGPLLPAPGAPDRGTAAL